MRRAALALAGLLAAAGAAVPAAGEPAEPAVTVPRSTEWAMTSADGKRHYKLMMAVPAGPPPAGGWPVIYVLDGNAFFGTVTEAVRLEAFLARYSPAVVVGIGYDTPDPIDIVSRNYDYTPPTSAAPEYDDRNPTRLAGGAETFVTFLKTQLMPAVAARASVDPRHQALLGHSYGGLFAAYAYIRHPGLFQDVIAVSASLWYKKFFVPTLVAGAPKPAGRLLLMAGENEQRASADEVAMLGPQRVQALAALKQVDSARDLATALAARGADARFDMMPGETHASVVPGAISRGVRFFLKPPSAAPAPPKGN